MIELTISLDSRRGEKLTFPEIPGAAAILNVDGRQTSSCTIKLTGGGEYRLSEIVALGITN